jgi:hypothetical protein
MRLLKGFKIPIVISSFLNITNTKNNFYQVSHISLPSSRPTAPRSVPDKSTTTHKTVLQVLTNKRFTGVVRKENAWVGMQSPYLWQHYKCGLKDCSHQKSSLKEIAYNVRIFRKGNMRGLQSRTLELAPHLRTKTAESLDAASPAVAYQKEEGQGQGQEQRRRVGRQTATKEWSCPVGVKEKPRLSENCPHLTE